MNSKLDKTAFNKKYNGKEIKLFTIKNSNHLEVSICNYGARVIDCWVPDKNQKFVDVVAGFESIDDYFNANEVFFGTTVGRYANRIRNATFNLDNTAYQLEKNIFPHTLHSGNTGYHNQVWKIKEVHSNSISLTFLDKHLSTGFPGNLAIELTYTLTNENELKIEYLATTDKKTVVNLTHHSYFNLSGDFSKNIFDHRLQINADYITAVDADCIPTGAKLAVEKSPFDFRKFKKIGKDASVPNKQLQFSNGYDHNFILNSFNGEVQSIAKIYSPHSRIEMEVLSNEPGVQLYCGNFLNIKDIGKYGFAYDKHTSFCLETQHFPDSLNNQHFPSTVLEPSQVYNSICIYKFNIAEEQEMS